MIYLAYTVHVVVCFFLILVVLLQQGKGADLSVFGGGSTQSAFGARGAATLLHKLTVGAFVAFILTTIGIGFLQGGGTTGSVMSTVEQGPVEPAVPVEDNGGSQVTEPAEEQVPASQEEGAVEEAPPVEGDESEEPPGSAS